MDRMKKMGLILLIMSMIIGTITGNHPQLYAFSNEMEIEETIQYDEKKTSAEIELIVKDKGKTLLKEVKDPSATLMDLNNLKWTTTSNGEFTFKITYLDKTSNKEYTIDKKVLVDGIIDSYQQERGVEEARIIFQNNNWKEDAENFNLTPIVVIPNDMPGGILNIHLPQYIDVNRELLNGDIDTGIFKSISIEGSSNDINGTNIKLEFKDNKVGNAGKDISIIQKDYIKYSKIKLYTIEATYRSADGNHEIAESISFSPKIEWSESIQYTLDKAILPNATELTFQMITTADITQWWDEFEGSIVIPEKCRRIFILIQIKVYFKQMAN